MALREIEDSIRQLFSRLGAVERAGTLPTRLGATNNLGAGPDPDLLTDSGWYSGNAWVGSLAGQSIGVLEVVKYSADWILQRFTSVSANPQQLTRTRHSGTTWTAWQTAFDSRYFTEAEVTSLIAAATPAGNITATARATAPAGFLLCDGALVSRTTYATLFAAISTTYGVGDGSTTFALPNLKGRVPVGIDTAQTEFDVRGEVGGAKTHTLTTAQIPSHVHPFRTTTATVLNLSDAASGLGTFGVKTAAGTALEGGPAGGGGAHNNLQPYMALNYLIKT